MHTITGYVDHIIYENKENGYAVLVLVSDGVETTAVGHFGGIEEGENLEVKGEFIEHPAYGEQLKVTSYRIAIPTDADSIERYLGSGAIKGVGPTLAARIVRYFGPDTFRIIEEEPERLSEVKGVSENKARKIAEQMLDKKDMREAFVFLQQHGISNTMAVRIYKVYGERLYGIIRENPYRLADDIRGIGFRTADEIALKSGFSLNSEHRVRSGIIYVLRQAAYEGHTYVPSALLTEKCGEILDIDSEAVEKELSNLNFDKKVIIRKIDNEPCVYEPFYYYAEQKCARLLHDLNVAMPGCNAAEEKRIDERIEAILGRQEASPDELQLRAIKECIRNGVVIISGGPGTGKTTTINSVISYFAEMNYDIMLAAPTGRAAKRMTETSGYEAKTIHRLLEVKANRQFGESIDKAKEANPKEASFADRQPDDLRNVQFERNEENPLETDVVIVDEMSMLDISLFLALLKAISVGTHLILVGDKDQLPSVGPGQVLRDIIGSDAFVTVILEKIYRQKGESDIVENAHRINRGEAISLDNKSKDFFFLERNDSNVIYKHMIQLITEKLPSYVNADPYDIQVLTPMRKGPLGVHELNRILQKYLNPPGGKKEFASHDTLYREGDKVMQVKNNYSMPWEIVGSYNMAIDSGTGIYNGDCGIIREINEPAGKMVVEFDEHRQVTYALASLEELELAYAITIHKSQGSEYPAIIMPLLGGPRLLFNRNLLYTGVTRARRLVVILGRKDTVFSMIANTDQGTRFTSLKERLVEIKCL